MSVQKFYTRQRIIIIIIMKMNQLVDGACLEREEAFGTLFETYI